MNTKSPTPTRIVVALVSLIALGVGYFTFATSVGEEPGIDPVVTTVTPAYSEGYTDGYQHKKVDLDRKSADYRIGYAVGERDAS